MPVAPWSHGHLDCYDCPIRVSSTVHRVQHWLRAPSPSFVIIEAALALALVVQAWADYATMTRLPDLWTPSWASPGFTALLVAISIGASALRRRYPLPCGVVGAGCFVAGRLFAVPVVTTFWTVLVLTFYAMGRHGEPDWRNRTRAVAGAAVLVTVIHDTLLGGASWGFDNAGDVDLDDPVTLSALQEIFSFVGVVVAGWWAGDLGRGRHEREVELAAKTDELERSRRENARRAVLDERVRIAREIHDIVAHHVSVMGLQAGAARRVVDRNVDGARSALAAIEESGRDAITELDRLLGFLRSETDDGREENGVEVGEAAVVRHEPAPTVGRLHELQRQLESAGVAFEMRVSGESPHTSPGHELNAYRIVQEAVTNSLKHGSPARIIVDIDYRDRGLALSVGNTGRREGKAPSPWPGAGTGASGHGLIGMAERVALFGGTLHHGPAPDGGYAVEAFLPWDEAVEPTHPAEPDRGTIRSSDQTGSVVGTDR